MELSPEEIEKAKKLISEIEGNPDPAKIEELFKVYDRNGNGVLEKVELKTAALQLMGDFVDEEEVDQLINELDINGDGNVDLKEFITKVIEQHNN